MIAVQCVLGYDALERMKKSHASCNVQRESDGLCGINYHASGAVQQIMQRSSRHILANDHQIRWRIACTQHGQNIRMRKDSQFGEFFVEIARDSCGALTYTEYLGDDVILLPASAPCVTGRGDRQFRMQFQIANIDALVARQSGIARACLQTQPALVFEAQFLQLLTTFDGQIMQSLAQGGFGFVQRRIAVFVRNRYQGAVID